MINVFFSIFSILAFLFAPSKYSYTFNLIILLLFLVQTIPFVIRKSHQGFINFYSLFYFSYFFVNFFYPIFIYPIDPEYFLTFSLGFNYDVISKASALAWLSSSFFILGASSNFLLREKYNNFKYIHNNATLFTGFLLSLFVFTVGRSFLYGNFTDQSAFSLYILQLIVCMFSIASILFFRDYNIQNNKKMFYIVTFIYIFIFLFVGDRGPALSLILMIIILYSHYVKKIKIIYILPFLFIGIFLMHIIGEGRDIEGINASKNILSRGLENFSLDFDSFYYMTLDFTVNAFTLYQGVDYVEKNGINYGATLFKDIISIVPFLQSFILSAFDLKMQTSSEFFTEYSLGGSATWGVGTNIVSDVYISFGLVGCAILFFIFGCLVEHFRRKFILTNSIQSGIVYIILVSFSIYMPRAGIFMPLKIIIWSIIIYYLLKSINLIKPKGL